MITETKEQCETVDQHLSGWGLRILVLAGLAVMTPLTILALWQHGIVGILSSISANSASLQIYVDLVVVCLLASVWLWHDSRRNGRRFTPWFLLTLVAGAFGPLFYLLKGMLTVQGKVFKKETLEPSDEVRSS